MFTVIRMTKLKKTEFNESYRFRESRNNLVNCATCDSKTGGNNNQEGPAYCENGERFRKVKIAEYWQGYFGPGKSNNVAPNRVCDAHSSKYLAKGIERPVLGENQAILLGSEFRDIHHADPACPYVMAELRMQKEGMDTRPFTKAGIHIIDTSEMVSGSSVNDICDMACCDSKLPYQIWRVSNYRRKTGLKPDGSEPMKWVRNGVVKHKRKSDMSIEEAEAFFDLHRFNSQEYGDIYRRISTVADYLHEHCNVLGSMPLQEAANPVYAWRYNLFNKSLVGPDTHADFWAYDERLFDYKKGLQQPIKDLEKIPEGIVPLSDPNKILAQAKNMCDGRYLSQSYYIYGILRSLEDEALIHKGLTHFIEVGAISFHGHEHMWGEFGKGFSGLASFDAE